MFTKYLLILLLPVTIYAQSPDTSIIYPQIQELLDLSETHASNAKYQEMYDVAENAASIALQELGPADGKYAECLQQQGYARYYLGEYKKSVSLFTQVAEIRKITVGEEHSDYATSLSNLGNAYKKTGNYEQAKTVFLETISIREKATDKQNTKYAANLNNLALLYKELANYEMAKPLFLQAKSIYEQELGKEHKSYATVLNNIAGVDKKTGNYASAETLYLETISIRKKTLGPEHPRYAQSLNNLAVLYKIMGNYEKAETLYLQAKSIREKVFDKEHPAYASSLNNLAALYLKKGSYESAEVLFLEAKSIREKKLGTDHTKYAESLNSLGSLYFKTGAYDKAETLLLQAKDIDEKALGKEHPTFAIRLNNLGNLYLKLEDYDKAETLFLTAKSIREKIFGKEHPAFVQCLNNLAYLYFLKKEYEKARLYFIAANKARVTILKQAADHLSGNELRKYLAVFEKEMAIFSSFIHQSNLADLFEEVYNNSLFYKGFLLENALRIEHAGTNAPDNIKEMYFEWKACRRRLSAEYVQPLSKRKDITELEKKVNMLEKALLKTTPALKEIRKQINHKDVLAHLKEGEAAIEFFHFHYRDPNVTDSVFYVAQILIAGESSPRQVFLFEEKELSISLEPKGARRADYVNNLYSLDARGVIVVGGKKTKSLYELIWQPLKEILGETKTIYFSPSGLLHRINLSAIPVADEENLASHYQLVRLNSTRQLISPTRLDMNTDNNKVVLYGGIQYNIDSLYLGDENRGNRGEAWSYLKGSQLEVDKVEKVMRANDLTPSVFTQLEATEDSFILLGQPDKPSPRILHIATHGYFYPDPKKTNAENSGNDEVVFKASERPMLRSGLILAGGNDSWGNEQPKAGRNDGILTALEISQLDLGHTDLVVLSACETGLGEIQGNEGVYGLQRAFKIAGVKYIVMSLWQVPDKQTSNLMKQFYTNWLEDKMPVKTAFTAAQKEMFEMGFDPYYWAGFVFVE